MSCKKGPNNTWGVAVDPLVKLTLEEVLKSDNYCISHIADVHLCIK